MEKALIFEKISAFGGDKRDRTADLLNAIQALSQLSYTPIFLTRCIITILCKKSKRILRKNKKFLCWSIDTE